MNILYIYAHPNSSSFNAERKNDAIQFLKDQGFNVILSDLYAQKFTASASWNDFTSDDSKIETQYFLAQQKAYLTQTLTFDIKKAIEQIHESDHIILQFPLWWFSVPAILKGWLDRVLVKGFAYDANKIFNEGLLKGKKASFVTSTQSPSEAYQLDGLHGASVDAFLHPIHHTFRFVGIETTTTFVTYAAYNLHEDQKRIIRKQYHDYLKDIFIKK